MRSLLGMWECDSEALLQAVRLLGVLEVRSLFGMLGVRSLFGMWGAIAVWRFGGCDRCCGCGVRSLFGGLEGAIAFGDVWDAIALLVTV